MWLVARDKAATSSALAGVVSCADVCDRVRVATVAFSSGAGRVAFARVLFRMGLVRLEFAIVGVSSSSAPLEMVALSFVIAPLETGAGIWKRGDWQGTIKSSVGCAGAAGVVVTTGLGAFGVGGSGGVDGRHVSKIRLSSSMATNCKSHVVDGTYLSAHMRRRTSCTIRLAGVIDG